MCFSLKLLFLSYCKIYVENVLRQSFIWLLKFIFQLFWERAFWNIFLRKKSTMFATRLHAKNNLKVWTYRALQNRMFFHCLYVPSKYCFFQNLKIDKYLYYYFFTDLVRCFSWFFLTFNFQMRYDLSDPRDDSFAFLYLVMSCLKCTSVDLKKGDITKWAGGLFICLYWNHFNIGHI